MNKRTFISLCALLVSLPVMAFAYNQGAVTWGRNSIFYPDGSVWVALPSCTDGGFNCVDGGWSTFDGGPQDGGIIDAGFADAGWGFDAGPADSNNDGGPLDGGWQDGGFNDGGWGIYEDGGYTPCLVTDAGFADGGWGFLAGPNDGGFADGGWGFDGGFQCNLQPTCTDGGFLIGFADGGALDGGPGDGGFTCLYVDAGNGYAGACGDGGFIDAGWGTFYNQFADGGEYDAGWVCAGNGYMYCADGGDLDGGPLDGGWMDGGMYDGGPVDGGWVDGGQLDGGWNDAGLVNLPLSDPYSAVNNFSVQCQVTGAVNVNGAVTQTLQGTNDLYPTSSSVYTPYVNTSATMAITDGGATTYSENSPPAAWSQVAPTANTLDGGLESCTYQAK